MSQAPHMELITELLPVIRRDFPLAVPALLNPTNANPLLDGEWMALDANYAAIRGTDDGVLGTYKPIPGTSSLPFQVFAEKGRYDTQAIGKVPLLFIGGYEAETDIVNTPHGFQIGDVICVASVTVGGVAGKKGLIKPSAAGQHLVLGWVTRLPANGRVRYWKSPAPTFMTI